MKLKDIKDIADSNEYVEGTGSEYAYNGFIEGFLVAMHLFKKPSIKEDTEFDELMDKLNK